MTRRAGVNKGKKGTVRSRKRPKHRAEDIYLEVSPYAIDVGEKIGVDPRKIPAKTLRALKGPTLPIQAIRKRCMDCCCGQKGEVRKCVSFRCPSWPFRMGTNPFHVERKVR
jgi:hypothetical protein